MINDYRRLDHHARDLPAMSAATHDPNGPSQGQHRSIGSVVKICHFNAEGLSRAKCECLSKVLLDNQVDVLALQETHVEEIEHSARATIPGYRLVDGIGHRVYGVATYVRQDIDGVSTTHKSSDGDVFVVAVKVSETTIVNVYKPPNTQWPDQPLPIFQHPVVYAGDFNSHHGQWGYKSDDNNGTSLASWAENNNLNLVYNAKDPHTFISARWRRGYSPDLCFVSCDRLDRPLPVSRMVLNTFPHSEHTPVIISVGIQIPLVRSFPVPRWNFNQADWESFSAKLDKSIRFIPPTINNYDRFTKLVLSTAKACIPRGFRKEYIPGWSRECENLYSEFANTADDATADLLLDTLEQGRREKWVKTVENLDFTHSSRKAWSLLRKLSLGKSKNYQEASQPNPCEIAKRLSRLTKSKKDPSDRRVNYKINEIKKSQYALLETSRPFTYEELETAMSAISMGKAAGLDEIFPEFLRHMGKRARQWLLTLFNTILETGVIPAIFKRSKIIAILKPGKEPHLPENYRPIALLSVSYKLLERLLYNRILPILNASIPVEQAGFRPGRNCCDQVLSLTSFIEDGFERKMKTSVAFIDLTAAYDTVWRKGLLVKLYKIIPCPSLVRLINSMLSDRMIKVYLGRKESSFRHLKDGLPQGSVLAPLLFNVYTADLPNTHASKFVYADDIALALQHKEIKPAEVALTNDLETLKEYFRTWKLNPNPSKTEVSCFHLNNRLANLKLKIPFDGVELKHNDKPQYLGVTLDRSLTFKSHLQKTAAKVKTRNNILNHLAGSTWGANAHVLRTTALSLVYSTAEYCAPVWLNSTHVREIDVQLNRAMRVVSGTLMATSLPWLPVLCNIAPPETRRKEALLREYDKILSAPQLPIHDYLPRREGRLRSRKPPLRTASQLMESNFSTQGDWISSWESFQGQNSFLIADPSKRVGGMSLPRKQWTYLNRFRTGVGRCNSWKVRWGMAQDPSCSCGADSQTMNHIVNDCPLTTCPGGLLSLHNLDGTAQQWLSDLDLSL